MKFVEITYYDILNQLQTATYNLPLVQKMGNKFYYSCINKVIKSIGETNLPIISEEYLTNNIYNSMEAVNINGKNRWLYNTRSLTTID